VYESDAKSGGSGQLYSAPVAGSAGINLTVGSDGEGPAEWSPDDQQLLFVSRRTGNADVFKMSANGTGLVNLTNRAGNDGVEGPHWMHGGADIVLGANHVYTAAADGSNLVNLTSTSGSEDHPVWSSDDKIYFVNVRSSPIVITQFAAS
jgi:TolB protein